MTSTYEDARFVRGIRRAWSLLRPEDRRRLRLVALYGVLIAGLDTVALILVFGLITLLDRQPLTGISRTLVDWFGVSRSDRYTTALLLFSITAALFLIRSIFSVVGLWLTVRASNEAQADLIQRVLFGHVTAPQLVRLERNTSETLRTVLTSADQVVGGTVSSSVSLVANIAVTVAVALALFLSSPLVAISVSLYFAAVAMLWVMGVRRRFVRRGEQIQELQKERYGLVLQSLAAAKELQLRGRELFYADRAVARTRSINAAARWANVANGGLRYVLETSLVVGAVLVVAAADLSSGRQQILPVVGLVLASAFRLLPALNQVLFLSNQVQYNSPAIRLVEIEIAASELRAAEQTDVDEGPIVPLALERELSVDAVSFRYPTRKRAALSGVSFTVRPGDAVGILGPTGSGKSTLLDVIMGILEPAEGVVRIDGVPLPSCRKNWQRSIGYVPQDVYLVDESLRANIALGWQGEEIDDDAVEDAVRLARLDDIVARLEDGLETVVGERGARLSGGQRQLVGIARALYVRPTILILDEATSNLDSGTEERIVDTLAGLRGGVTSVIVTHRPSSVRHCDTLVYLENGSIEVAGTPAEVAARLPAVLGPAARDTLSRTA